VADRPSRLWVADLTYVKTHVGFVYVASCSTCSAASLSAGRSRPRCAATWPSTPWRWPSIRAALVASRGWCTTAIAACSICPFRYTERLAEVGVVNSVGSRGDSYDNAMAESFNGLYKTELIFHEGP